MKFIHAVVGSAMYCVACTLVLAQQAGQAHLTGIYRAPARPGENTAATLAIADPAANSPNFKFLVFFKDGRVKRGLITSGVDAVVPESQMRLDISSGGKDAAQWGLYQMATGRGRIVFANSSGGQQLVSGLRGEVWNFVHMRGQIQVNGETYLMLRRGNGLQLDGLYKPMGDASQRGIRFTRDGQFIDEGILDSNTAMAVGMVGGGVGMAYGFSAPKAGRGTYHIANYGLSMRYTNGQAPTPLFFLEPADQEADTSIIYINNFKYQRMPN